jgi:hypothetical protein
MPHRFAIIISGLSVFFAATGWSAAEPLFATEDGGRTFVYHSRPGDYPGGVAAMFGIEKDGLAALLAANGIPDANRVPTGFVYRIPNEPARQLAERVAALEEDNVALARTRDDATLRAATVGRELETTRATAAAAEQRASRLERIERLWPLVEVTLLLLLVVLGLTVAVARAALRQRQHAERFAKALAREAEGKRCAHLAERQENARRILDLETRLRDLERQAAPRVVIARQTS